MTTYATVKDVEDRLGRILEEQETGMVEALLEDAALIIDAYNAQANPDVKKIVSVRMIIRALPSSATDIPIGATQGGISALGYSQNWTLGGSGSSGELYLGRLEKKLLGVAKIGTYSPVEDLCTE